MKRIFLSYGHDEYAEFACQLKMDLESYGYEVWFDIDRLKPGGDWENYIEEGLERVCAQGSDGRVILLMTPHSVRRPDGYCLNEVARALQRHMLIIPVMLATCEPPLSICRIQWVDMRECVQLIPEKGERYRAAIAQLVKAVDSAMLDFEGGQARLLNVLDPLPFEAELSFHMRRFVGRQWLVRKVEEWMNQTDSQRVFWLVGAPGIGKTAFASWLCTNRADVVGFHLCQQGSAEKSDPKRIITSLAYQISSQVPAYAALLHQLPLERIVAQGDAYSLWDRLFVQLMTQLRPIPEKPLLIVIDALDESLKGFSGDFVELLATEFGKTPEWLRLITTSRPDRRIIDAMQGFNPEKLEPDSSDNCRDIEEFVRHALCARVEAGPRLEALVLAIMERSEGIFLYVEQVVQEILEGRLSEENPNLLPHGLGGILRLFFARQFRAGAEFLSVRPVLETIAAASEPLSTRTLAEVFNWDEHGERDFLGRMGGLFSQVQGCLQPFHKSMMDWCTNPERAGDYYVSIPRGHEVLAEHGWKVYEEGAGKLSSYMLSFLPTHLACSGSKARLEQLLTDLAFTLAKCRARSVDSLLADYNLLAPAKATGSTCETWRTFLRERAHILRRGDAEWPTERILFQMAIEHADTSPITAAAETALRNGAVDWVWLRRLNRNVDVVRNPCLRIFEGHENSPISNGVYGAVILADGRLVSWGADGTIRLWDIETGRQLHVLQAADSAVRKVQELSDSRLFSWSAQGISVWDLQTATLKASFPSESTLNHSVALEDQRALCCHSDGSVSIISLSNGEWLEWWRAGRGEVSSAIPLQGGRILSWSSDNTLAIWSGRENPLLVLEGHSNGVFGACELADGRIVSWSYDSTVRVWNSDTGESLLELVCGYSGAVTGAIVLSTGCLLTWGNTPQIWDLNNGRCIGKLVGQERVAGACELPDKRILTWGWDYTLRTWDSATGEALTAFAFGQERGNTNPSVWLRAGGQVITSDGLGLLRLWDLDRAELLQTLSGHTDHVGDVLELGTDWIISVASDNTLRLWNIEPTKSNRESENSRNAVQGATCLGQRRLLSWSDEGEMELWDLETGQSLAALSGHSGAIVGAIPAFENQFLTWSRDGTLRLWETKSGRPVMRFKGHTGEVSGAFCLSDHRLLSWGEDCTLRIWETRFGQVLSTLRGHLTGELIFFPIRINGVTLLRRSGALSWSDDSTLRLWDTKSGQMRALLAAHTEGVKGALEVDDDLLLSWSLDGTILLWDMRSGQPIQRFHGHTEGVDGVLTLQRGRILSWAQDGSLRIWDRNSGMCLTTMVTPHISDTLPIENSIYNATVLRNGDIVSSHINRTIRLWDPQSGALKASVPRDDAPQLHPDWFAAYPDAPASGGFVAWVASRRIGISADLPDGAVAALWDADAEVRVFHLDANGLVAVGIAGRPIEFLALFNGDRRISLADVPGGPRTRPREKGAAAGALQPPEATTSPAPRDKGGWRPFLDHVPERLADAFTQRGFESAKGSRFDEALQDFDQAVRLHPERTDALFYRARIHFLLQNRSKALADLDRAVELAPDMVPAYCLRARVYLESGELLQALDDFEIALEINFDQAVKEKADLLRGQILMDLRRWKDAIEVWTEILMRQPDLKFAYAFRALAREALGDLAGAKEDQKMSLDERNPLSS